jgi:hypothetical protein
MLIRISHLNSLRGSLWNSSSISSKNSSDSRIRNSKQLGWDIRRNLAKINYRIHTDAIKENLIPAELNPAQINQVYASEADLLNMALFGLTAKEWRDSNPGKSGNIRDYADISQLVCLSNLENLSAHFIGENISQPERLGTLNAIAIHQMTLLTRDATSRLISGGT